MNSSSSPIFTIGHSSHDFATFLNLLDKSGVTAIADVRSAPVSRFAPQFNRDALETGLADAHVKYAFLGRELGARSPDPACYENGRVVYARLEQSPDFARGMARLMDGIVSESVAIMCTEKEPLDCHRTLLIAEALVRQGVHVAHIHSDGHVEDHQDVMDRLMWQFGLFDDDLFRSRQERLTDALHRQEARIAYTRGASVAPDRAL